ncbi:MAG: UvrD-helicase domain-containing protein [Acidobacteriota bacterium]
MTDPSDSTALAADRRARRVAQEVFDRPLVIEAGAGTGKTATLVARVLAWCLGPGWTRAARALADELPDLDRPALDDDHRIAARVLRRVVAVTFTEAAATEMAERISSALRQVRDGEIPVGVIADDEPAAEVRARRAAHLLAVSDQLQTRTLHGFCRKLLADHPFAAGIHPFATVDADGATVRTVVEDIVAATLPIAYGDPGDPDLLHLAGLGIGPSAIAEALETLIHAGVEPSALERDPFADDSWSEFVRRLEQDADALLEMLDRRLTSFARAPNARKLTDALRRLLILLEDAEDDGEPITPDALLVWHRDHLGASLVDHLAGWSRGELNQTETEHLAVVARELRAHATTLHRRLRHLGRLDPERFSAARRALAPLLDKARDTLRRRGVLTFGDLLASAEKLLRERPEVTARIRRQIDQLLVDEFQDTDPVQCSLVGQLALDGTGVGLFVVGDPKQSIYGWRNADLAAYEDFVARVESNGGERLPLVENFRSAPPILDEVSRLLAPVMIRRPGVQPAFEPLVACERLAKHPGFHHDTLRPIEYWLAWAEDGGGHDEDGSETRLPAVPSAGQAARLEARALVSDLHALRQAGTRWSEIAILLRNATDLEAVLAPLREHGIPFTVSRDRQYYRRREIIDAAAWVRAILAPEDSVALLTVMRGVLVGVPDAALPALWRGDFPSLVARLDGPDETVFERCDELIAEAVTQPSGDIPGLERIDGWWHNLRFAVRAIAELRASYHADSADLFVNRLRHTLLLEATEAARWLGPYRRANLRRFFTELRDALLTSANRFDVLRALRTRIARETEAEEAPPRELGDDAIHVLTIHKAKGLEFRHVYLLQTHRASRPDRASTVDVDQRGGDLHLRLFGVPSPGWDLVHERREQVEHAELVRTLYVASTRAVERLVIAGKPVPAGDLIRASTHAELLPHRHERPRNQWLYDQWTSGEPRHLDGQGVAWVFPARIEPPEPEPRQVDDVVTDATAVEGAQRALDEHREQARATMARPWLRTASSLGHADETPNEERTEDESDLESRISKHESQPTNEASDFNRRVAQAAGTIAHAVLEHLDLHDAEADLERQSANLADHLPPDLTEDEARASLERADDMLAVFRTGPLFTRLVTLADHILARELPLVVPPDDTHALGAITGTLDLLYRDPDSGDLTIVDYKTDRVLDPEHYREQARTYRQAIASVMGVKVDFELWSLTTGRRHRL